MRTSSAGSEPEGKVATLGQPVPRSSRVPIGRIVRYVQPFDSFTPEEEIDVKVKVPVFLLMMIAAMAGYLLGTESGQEQRDRLLEKLGRARAETDMALDIAEAAIEDAEAAEAVAEAATSDD